MNADFVVALITLVVAAAAVLLALTVRVKVRAQAAELGGLSAAAAGLRVELEQVDRQRLEFESAAAQQDALAKPRLRALEEDQQQLWLSLRNLQDAAAETSNSLEHDRAKLGETSERLVLEHTRLSEQVRSTLSAEADSSTAFRKETVEEVVDLLRRHTEMLRTEMAAIVSPTDA